MNQAYRPWQIWLPKPSKKLIVLLLVFLFILTPLAPAFAQVAHTVPGASDAPSASPDTPRTTTDTPVNDISPAPPVPKGNATITSPVTVPPLTDATPPDDAIPVADQPIDQKPVAKTQPMSLLNQQQDPASVPRATTEHLLPDTDQASGSLTYSFPIVVPPGRNGLQPDLKITYHNQGAEDGTVFGIGWSADIPYIERINRKGTDQLYSQDYFNSSLSGELNLISGTSWGSKVDNGEFLSYVLLSNTWTATDKKGTVYKFGSATGARQDDPNDTTRIYRWMLEEIRDTNNNYIKYAYYKDAGQIYPSQILYTGNGTTDGVFEVNFLRQSRGDIISSNKTGFTVTSNYRINEINTKVSGTLAHKYALSYSSGANGFRSVLASITESGNDDLAVTTTLPATTLRYQAQTPGWTADSAWAMPSNFRQGNTNLAPTAIADINGDGLLDEIFSGQEWSTGCSCWANANHVWLNNGNGFTPSTSWTVPELLLNASWTDNGTILTDVNGDGLADLLFSGWEWNTPSSTYVWHNRAYINSGTAWILDTSWSIPEPFVNSPYVSGSDHGVRVADVNNDGLPDILFSAYEWDTPSNSYVWHNRVYINNGGGWTLNTAWSIPTSFLYSPTVSSNDNGVRIVEVNGDGLADIIFSGPEWDTGTSTYTHKDHVWLNTGSGWALSTSWTIPESVLDVTWSDNGVRFADINGDGLNDVLFSGYEWDNGTNSYVWHNRVNINSGAGWTLDTSWSIPVPFILCVGSCWKDNGVRIADVNGDGLPDVMQADFVGAHVTYIKNGHKIDSLTQIANTKGGTTTVTYKPSAQSMNGSTILNPKMSMIIETVSQVSNNDGSGNTNTTQYAYEGGELYFNGPFDRKFAGYSKATRTDDAGNKVTSYYHQGDTSDSIHGEYSDHISKVGKVYRTEITDSSGNMYIKSINKWDRYDLGNGRNFVKQLQQNAMTYDGDMTHKDIVEAYTYDNTNGNLIQKVQYGQVIGSDDGAYTDTGTDLFTTTYAYANGGTVVGFLDDVTTVDQSGTKVKETRYYYDSQALGSVTKGNLTKQEDWKTNTTYINHQKSYDGIYGLVTVSTDPRGKTTQYSYDAYYLYPATVTNALTQTTSFTYDYSSGQVKQKTDPNTRVFQNIYDGLDRLTEEEQPDIATPSNLVVRTTYVYIDTTGSVSVKKSSYLNSSTMADSYTYFDGLGRKIQERTEAEGTNFVVKDYIYDNRDMLDKESLPYFSIGASKTSATTDTTLYTIYDYDPSLRMTTSVNNLGTTTNSYNDWRLTVTDPNGKTKDLYKDAYSNLIQVDEHNGASTYSTYYVYSHLGNLTKLTDALANVRNFTYDGLGRRLTAQDLHASNDVTFGTWTYSYDDAGNLTQTIDPKSQTINYTYDNLNRLLTEDYTGQTWTEVTYTYDIGTDGIGKLTNVVSSVVTKALVYNALGLTKQETDTLNSTNYVTLYDYDRQGNQINITNPDNSQVKYIYNSAGLLDQVQRKETTDGSFINVVSNFDYGPHGKVTVQTNANGTTTTNTYDSTKLYRLTHKVTTGPGGGGSPTTVSFFPQAGDGSVYKDGSSWATAHDATSGSSAASAGTTFSVRSGKSSAFNSRIERGFLPFDTSSLPDTAVVSSAKLKVYVDSKLDDNNDGNDWVTVTQGTEASSTSLTISDYNKAGSASNPTEGIYNTERKDITGVATGQYLVFNLNPVGRGWISATASTKLALREGQDAINSAFTGSSGQYNQLTIRSSEYTGTSSDPILEVTYYTSTPRPTTLQDLSYTYDSNGNVTQITDVSGTDTTKVTTYVYDDLNRLTSSTITGAANGDNTGRTYTYDAIGNISSSSDLGAYTYAGIGYANPHAVTGIGSTIYTYDNNGNQTGDGTWTNTWDYNDRMTQSRKSGVTVTYAYDPSGQRVYLANGFTATYYPTNFYNTDGTTAQKHILANGIMIATVKGTGASASVYTNHADHLTGANVVTNSSAGIVEVEDYQPYGASRIDWQYSSAFDEQRKFTGQEYDRDTGLNYLNARYYDGNRGRFISQDSAFINLTHLQVQLADPQLMNSYSYARNNPLVYNDLDGQWPTLAQVNAFLAEGDRYNPLHILFGPDTNRLSNAIATGNGKEAAKAGGNIALTTGAVIITAWDVAAIAADAATAYRAYNRYQRYQQELQAIEERSATRKVDDLVSRIDSHGSYEKHVLGINNPYGKEYGSLFKNEEQWNSYVGSVISRPSASFSGPEKDLYWDDRLGTIVINNKTGGPPTSLRPQEGKQYYLDRVAEQKAIIKK